MLARFFAVLAITPLAFAATCEDLKKLDLKNTTITLVQPSQPGVCRVAATLKPSNDSDIRIEVWLPEKWNGKLEGNGNGGWSGSIAPATLARGVERGYATVMTDTGHQGGSGSFALGHPEKLIDFGYRSTHEMTVAAKAIVSAYYGQSPKLSYFTGCSAGGRQGLMEAQRFPDDYDGIVAGSPGANWSGRALLAVWIAQAVHKDDASFIPTSLFPLIHEAALAACDAQDGVKDGVIDQPSRCKFDPKVLACKGDATSGCLTAAQVETARRMYTAVTNPRTGAFIAPAFSPGSEMGWATMGSAQPLSLGTDLFRFVVFKDPDWDFRKFDFDADIERTMEASASLNALDPDLKKFATRGGKLIQYHGWSDPQIAPGIERRVFQVGGGQGRCQGCGRFLSTIYGPRNGALHRRRWHQHVRRAGSAGAVGGAKKGAEQIPAARVRDGKTDRTRPLCPYPQVAVYKGTGSTDEALNFTCKVR